MFIPSLVLLLLQLSGMLAYDVSTSNPNPSVPEFQGVDLKCSYTADFGTPRVEWNFKNLEGSQRYVIYDRQPTENYMGRVEQYSGGLRFKNVTRFDNGEYNCLVSGNSMYGEAKIRLTVQVPPSVPICGIPASVTTGTEVLLTCFDKTGSPPNSYKWFKNKTPLPDDPTKFDLYKNSTYTLNSQNGNLRFARVSKADAGEYHCTASNGIGSPQSCVPMVMTVKDRNVGGIVAGVIIALLIVAAVIFGVWFARRKGYLPKKTVKGTKQGYTQPTVQYSDNTDGDFKQKSSFVV